MTSEWLKIMLEEIARKQDEAKRAVEEERRRADERAAQTRTPVAAS